MHHVSAWFPHFLRSTAFGVNIRDTLPPNSKLVDGSLEIALANVQVGSHMKANYTIVFTVGALTLDLPQAKVSYKPEFKTAVIQVRAERDINKSFSR